MPRHSHWFPQKKRENGKKLKISHNFFAAASVFIVPLGEFAGT